MPAGGLKLKRHEDILRLEEILEVAKYAADLGFTKVRLTGGEPLVRKNIEFLVEKIADLPAVEDFGLTTNGILLADRALSLKKLGLHRVNISLDSLNDEKFRLITRGGELKSVLAGINAAREAGLTPIKINVVLIPGFNDREKDNFIKFGAANNLEIRFIHLMDLQSGQRHGVEGNTTVGQCKYCDRLRLTCDGYLQSCLFSEEKVNIREVGITKAFSLALEGKPEEGTLNTKDQMYQIGG
jgi:cyclic pyranopterin phosphate synthase